MIFEEIALRVAEGMYDEHPSLALVADGVEVEFANRLVAAIQAEQEPVAEIEAFSKSEVEVTWYKKLSPGAKLFTFPPASQVVEKCSYVDNPDECLAPFEFPAPPEGWKLVPVEPTVGMAKAWDKSLMLIYKNVERAKWKAGYQAMIAAAPTPGETK